MSPTRGRPACCRRSARDARHQPILSALCVVCTVDQVPHGNAVVESSETRIVCLGDFDPKLCQPCSRATRAVCTDIAMDCSRCRRSEGADLEIGGRIRTTDEPFEDIEVLAAVDCSAAFVVRAVPELGIFYGDLRRGALQPARQEIVMVRIDDVALAPWPRRLG